MAEGNKKAPAHNMQTLFIGNFIYFPRREGAG